MNRRNCAPGFTLIEMMLAVAILGLILVMLAGSFHAVAASKLHAEGRMDAEHAGRSIIWEMTAEIRGAVQTPVAMSRVLLRGNAQFLSGKAANAISVSTLDAGHRRSITGHGSENIVTYSLKRNPNHEGWLLLERAEQNGLDPNVDYQPVTIADNVLSLRIRYFDGNQWGDTWNSDNLSPGMQLPLAVSIDLDMAAPNGRDLRFATEVIIPMSVAQW